MSSQNYILHVTAGPSRDRATHETVHVNEPEPVVVETESVEVKIWVRIRGYRGLPHGSPESAPYFTHPKHLDDRYSIQFNFRLKEGTPEAEARGENKNKNKNKTNTEAEKQVTEKGQSEEHHDVTGDDLLLGNDFDRPIRDKLPPGFSTAFRIVKWFIDPGIESDVDADKPYLYGPLLSSINTLEVGELRGDGEEHEQEDGDGDVAKNGDRVSGKGESKGMADEDTDKDVRVLEEGGPEDNAAVREELQMPGDSKSRMKYYLNAAERKNFVFEKGREYRCDFYNPYLDFNEFALRLPGFTLNIMRYWDGQPLRYVLKNRSTDEVYFVVSFDLLPVDEQGKLLSPGSKDILIENQNDGTKPLKTATSAKPSSGLSFEDSGVD